MINSWIWKNLYGFQGWGNILYVYNFFINLIVYERIGEVYCSIEVIGIIEVVYMIEVFFNCL